MGRSIFAALALVVFSTTASFSQPAEVQFDGAFEFEPSLQSPEDGLPALALGLPRLKPPAYPMPDVSTVDIGGLTWAKPADDADAAFVEEFESACAACYPGPEIAPFPVPVIPLPAPAQRPRLFQLPQAPAPEINVFPRAGEMLATQLLLLDRVSENDICRAIVAGVLRRDGDCVEGRLSEPTDHVEVLRGGEVVPVFLIHVSSRSQKLSQFDRRALEAHRYYLLFMIDPKMQLNMVLFDYEPLFNRTDEIEDVLNRFQQNTTYIPVTANEGIVGLTQRMRVAISDMLIALAAQ